MNTDRSLKGVNKAFEHVLCRPDGECEHCKVIRAAFTALIDEAKDAASLRKKYADLCMKYGISNE